MPQNNEELLNFILRDFRTEQANPEEELLNFILRDFRMEQANPEEELLNSIFVVEELLNSETS